MKRLLGILQRLWIRIRFGNLKKQYKVEEWVAGVQGEIAYYDRQGNIIGYYAYGYYDPALPFQGYIDED